MRAQVSSGLAASSDTIQEIEEQLERLELPVCPEISTCGDMDGASAPEWHGGWLGCGCLMRAAGSWWQAAAPALTHPLPPPCTPCTATALASEAQQCLQGLLGNATVLLCLVENMPTAAYHPKHIGELAFQHFVLQATHARVQSALQQATQIKARWARVKEALATRQGRGCWGGTLRRSRPASALRATPAVRAPSCVLA